ncbi:MAG: hypothetical protein HC915_11570 [Anaerolineae bacterium]|nr:hypothetical protein [Anaerolineae bacterium]
MGPERLLLSVGAQHAQRPFYQCTRFTFSEITLADMPTHIDEALAFDDPEARLNLHIAADAMFHGHDPSDDAVRKVNIERFLQQVEKEVSRYLNQEHAPLLLAGVDYLLDIYANINPYPHLITDHQISGNHEHTSPETLHRMAVELMQPYFMQAQRQAVADYRQLAATSEQANAQIVEVLTAAYQGRVRALMVSEDDQCWGTFDPLRLRADINTAPQPGDEDLLDLAVALTLRNGGEVHAMPGANLPDDAPLAAVYRY